MGKIVIKFPKQDTLPLEASVPEPAFREGVSYLLVGGTRGLGKAIASWMVTYRAQSLIFLLQSAGESTEDREFFNELRANGYKVQCVTGDVANPTTIQTVIREAPQPIAGVLQMAMVLSDARIMNMDIASWNTTIRPKVEGTWNLHQQLPADLDFFILFSSASGLLGYSGQANYASANTFLNSLIQYRHAHNQVASVIDIGAVDEIGFVACNPGLLLGMTYQTYVREQTFLDALQLAIALPLVQPSDRQQQLGSYHHPSQIGLIPGCHLPMDDSRNTVFWKRDPHTAIYRNVQAIVIKSSGNDDALSAVRTFIASLIVDPAKLKDEESAIFLAHAIRARVATFLMRDGEDIDISQTLEGMGVDSLVAIELRNWWRQSFNVDVSILELMNGGSIHQLGDFAISRLKVQYGPKGDGQS